MSEYTSNLLCHFVGRSKKTDEERFELLTQIISGGKLIANIKRPDKPESLFIGGSNCDHVGEVYKECDCVCFCDIPNEALTIHTSKYGSFGLGFDKNFIAAQGARPVMYVPHNYPIIENGDSDNGKGGSETPRNPEQYYPYILNTAVNFIAIVDMLLPFTDLKKAESLYKAIGLNQPLDASVWNAVFSKKSMPLGFSILQGLATQSAYVKLFDATLPDDHPDNYYMEREWRCLKNVLFSLDDIKTVYLPNESYKTRFSAAFPTYHGEIKVFGKR